MSLRSTLDEHRARLETEADLAFRAVPGYHAQSGKTYTYLLERGKRFTSGGMDAEPLEGMLVGRFVDHVHDVSIVLVRDSPQIVPRPCPVEAATSNNDIPYLSSYGTILSSLT